MTVYLRTRHWETIKSVKSGKERPNRVITEWHMPVTPEEAALSIAFGGGRAMHVLPPFKDTRWT